MVGMRKVKYHVCTNWLFKQIPQTQRHLPWNRTCCSESLAVLLQELI